MDYLVLSYLKISQNFLAAKKYYFVSVINLLCNIDKMNAEVFTDKVSSLITSSGLERSHRCGNSRRFALCDKGLLQDALKER